ncbi:MAG: lipoprotein signal peptidase [Bacteroidales bacterium]
MRLSNGQKAILIIFLTLLIDQISKIWIKTHFELGQHIEVTKWFYIYFTENNGMAFGIEVISKLFLTVFRIVAIGFIGYYLYRIIRNKRLPFGYIACISMIFAGAMGNIVDSVFYGEFFTHSYGQVAQFLPEGGGYAGWFHGKVVDMLYFPIIDTTWPEWMPVVGGDDFVFFRPIFNIADSAITVGVALLLIFYRKILMAEDKTNTANTESNENK